MTQEEKAKAYDEALEKAKEILEMTSDKSAIYTIFPELEESEDEKIRKGIFKALSKKDARDVLISQGIEVSDALAWLEKQGEKKPLGYVHHIDEDGCYTKEAILEPNPYTGTGFDYNGHHWGMCARDNGVEILFDGELKAFLSLEKSFIYPIHPQPYFAPKSAMEAIKEEKVDNQNCVKPADKVEPKFHEGQWITNGDYIWKIVEVRPLDYTLLSQDDNIVVDTISHVDEQFHSFTIADARDGDVLLFEGYYNSIVLFQGIGINGAGHINYHCKCDLGNYSFNIQGDVAYLGTIEKNAECFHPATKEQRDTLLKAMADAGYTFDFENKKLKKIEQKSAWSEEDDDDAWMNDIISKVENNLQLNKDEIDWLKSIKGRVQPKQEWSEEDEPQKELAEIYLAKFDKKFPILPTLKGKRLADYKNFLNKCQQIFGLKYWGVRSRQAKLFEKLSLLWAAWGAEHLQGLGQIDGDMDDEILWSEEDEKMFKSLKTLLNEASCYSCTKGADKILDWLKSLKQRIQKEE